MCAIHFENTPQLLLLLMTDPVRDASVQISEKRTAAYLSYVSRLLLCCFPVNTAHNGHANSLTFTPDGLHLLTFGTDEKLRLWETLTGRNTMVNYGRLGNESRKCVRMAVCDTTKPNLAFAPSDSDVEMFDVFTGLSVTMLQGHYSQVNSCVFQQSTNQLYTASNDRNILIFTSNNDSALLQMEEARDAARRHDSSQRNVPFTQRTGAMADAWSSDED